MNPAVGTLWSVAALLGLSVLAVAIARRPAATRITYAVCLAICIAVFIIALAIVKFRPQGIIGKGRL